MRILKIFLISMAVIGTVIVAAINVVLNLNTPIMSNLTLQNMEASTNESGEGGSNNSGSGNMYYYTHLEGRPKTCTLYKYINASGNVRYGSNSSDASVGAGYTYTGNTVGGIVETCPKSGTGCTIFSCHVTNNTNP